MAKKKYNTDEIKERLVSYNNLRKRLINKSNRLAAMPKVKASEPSSLKEREIEKRIALETTINFLIKREIEERECLESIVEELQDPNQQTVIEMRYFDEADWGTVCSVIFSDKEDYIDNHEKYERYTYRIHGNALAELYKIVHKEEAAEDQYEASERLSNKLKEKEA
jgi:hypothetical protein